LANEKIPHNFFNISAVEAYFKADKPRKAIEVADRMSEVRSLAPIAVVMPFAAQDFVWWQGI